MASSSDVMTAFRSIFESAGVKAERLIQDLNTRVDEMETDSSESSADDESDEDEMEENFPGLLELEALTMIIKLWLHRIQETQQDQRKTLQDFENKLYRVLNESIEPFKATSNKSKDSDLPMLQHYIERLSEACDGLKKETIKVNFQTPEEDRRRLDKHTVFVCSLLGLRLDFLDRLEEMPPETRDHQTLCYWIVNFLRNNNETLTATEKNSLSYKDQLYAIGFDPLSSAVESILERAGSTFVEQHIEACEWAERRIQDEFKYNVLLSQRSKRFPFEIDGSTGWLERDGVIIANVVTKKSESSMKTQSMLRKFERLYDEQQVFLFHGTDHKSACDIMSGRGIHLGAGRKKRDFSSGAGFYLTKNLDEALSWAYSTTVKPAILVFRVELDFLNRASKLNLNEGDGLTKWREIVNFFRLDKGPGNLRSSLSAYDLIEGKSARATRSGPTNGNDLMFEQNPSSYQMCLISKKFADMFQEKLHSIFFYDIS